MRSSPPLSRSSSVKVTQAQKENKAQQQQQQEEQQNNNTANNQDHQNTQKQQKQGNNLDRLALSSFKTESEADSESATWMSLEDSRSELSCSTNSSERGEDSAFSPAEIEEDERADELLFTQTSVTNSGEYAVMFQVENLN